jgi:hypothetical protein
MFRNGHIYTVHENPEREEPSERIELVREGFSVWAFIFNMLWLLSEKLWLAFAVYLAIVVAIVELGPRYGLGEISMGILQFALQFFLGLHAHDLQRDRLVRKGYALTGVVIAESELLATQRAHQHPAVVI